LHPLAQKATIQKCAAVLLLLVFLISIAPKAFFHDVVANHKDLPDCRQFHHSTVLHQQAFDCHFDHLVATDAFELLTEPAVVLTVYYFDNQANSFYHSHLQAFFQHKESRGPPSV
jgi:hypothetical protein